ncbi:hypothetical protein M8J76_010441 [Diaphorina citri]|nr:hypothetical protein M8J76_010441 [Diaphorina citri]
MPTSMLQMMDQLTNLENALTKLAEKLNVTPADPQPPARRTETIPVLPEFHPSRGTDPLQWINTIELCFDEDTKINSRALILTLSRSMKGSAASWFARQANSHLCWDDFKLAFVGEFAVLDTPATALNELFTSLVPRVAKYCDLQKVDDQWRKLPLVQLPEDITQCTEPDMFWGKLLKYKNLFNETEFIELARFALDTLCLPHANADCESI